MRTHEGRLIARTLIQHVETSAIATRTLMDLTHLLSGHMHELNRCVVFITILADIDSDVATGDIYKLSVKTYGMTLHRELTSMHLKGNDLVQEIEFPLCGVGIPDATTPLDIRGKFNNFVATETHRVLIEAQIYLLDEGPDQLVVKSF